MARKVHGLRWLSLKQARMLRNRSLRWLLVPKSGQRQTLGNRQVLTQSLITGWIVGLVALIGAMVLFPPQIGQRSIFIALASAVLFVGFLIGSERRSAPKWFLDVSSIGAYAVIGSIIYFGHGTTSTYAIFYFWPSVHAAHFTTRKQLNRHILIAIASYGAVLLAMPPKHTLTENWLLLAVSLAVVSHLVALFHEGTGELAAIVESANDPMVELDLEGIIRHWNKAAERFFGYTSAEAIGNSILNVISTKAYPVDLDRVMTIAHSESGSAYYESTRQRRDGSPVEVSISLSATRDALGSVTGINAIYQDISRRKESERALLASEERFRSLFQNSSDIVTVLDGEGTVLTVTSGIEQLGTQADTIIGHLESQFVHPDDLNVYLQAFADTKAFTDLELSPQQRSIRFEVRFRTSVDSNEWRWQEVVLCDLLHVPAVAGVVANHRDITQRRELEAELFQARKLESVGQLAAGLAHEINTPIQFIGDNLRFLDQVFDELMGLVKAHPPGLVDSTVDMDFLAEEVPSAIDQSLQGVERVATLVRALKMFADPGQTSAQPADLVDGITNTMVVADGEIRHIAVAEFNSSALPPVVCVLNEINQVFLNLIVNAAQAIEGSPAHQRAEGRITVTCRQDGRYVVIGVHDNGGGIPEDARDKIFDPFFTTKEVGRGAGQGLNVAYAIIERHEGSITFDTELDVGTTFWVRLPIDGPSNGNVVPTPLT